jgi:TonB-dependent receptor
VKYRMDSVRGPAARAIVCLTLAAPALAQGPDGAAAENGPPRTAAAPSEVQEVVVTGYRKSLEDATSAKRESITFSDSVFAEDIGKFPDLNIAESLNRVPGVQLTRDANGDGLNVSIRGLGTSFTKVTLNNAEIAVASSGRIDAQNQNREIDLVLFPTELFTRLDVYKTPTADMIEGGAAGIVNMRSARPFDNPGAHFTYQVQGQYGENGHNVSPRGAALASWTNDTFGVLAGIAAVSQQSTVTGYETIGWTNPTVTYGMCGTSPPAGTTSFAGAAPTCNTTGGNGWGFPGVPSNSTSNGIGVVPAGVGNGLTAGTPIDAAFLLAHNPGLTLNQISNAIIPRLGRNAYIDGVRNRVAEILSFEYRPDEHLQFYVDGMFAKSNRNFNRLDMDLVGRSGGLIPLNEKVDANDVVTSATFANAQWFLEDRPYKEDVKFLNVNPGLHWEPNSILAVDAQVNMNRSTYQNLTPTVLINTPLGQGITLNYSNAGQPFPNTVAANVNLNDPNAGWTWAGGRVNIQGEKRDTSAKGAHLDVKLGKDDLNARVGAAFDDVQRTILGLDNSAAWQQAVCGGNGTYNPPPAAQPPCTGGAGSLIPQSALAGYITPGPGGFIQVDTNRLFADSNFYQFAGSAPIGQSAATGASSGGIREKTYGTFVELNTVQDLFGHQFRGNAGLRYIKTIQTVSGPYILGGVTQPGVWQNLITDYNKALPSLNLSFNVLNNVVTRFSASKSITRPNPSNMLPSTTFTDQSGSTAKSGNAALRPYFSNNLDIGGEWYTGAEGYVSLDLFQKKLTGFTVNGITVVPFNSLNIPFSTLSLAQQTGVNSRGGPDAATVNLQQQINATGELKIQGVEANWVQPLGRLWDPLDGFGFTVNYTHVKQTADGAGVPAQAFGISPNTYNATIYFEKYNASIRFSYVWNAAQILDGFNQQGIPLAELFTDAYGQLDMSASYTLDFLPTKPAITLNAINITDEKQRSTFQFANATNYYYDPGYQILLGIRGKF